MNVMMPNKDGVEACREIMETAPEIRVVMLTASTEEDAVVEAVAAGATGYLRKETGLEQLLSAVRDVVQGKLRVPVPVVRRVFAAIRDPGPPQFTLYVHNDPTDTTPFPEPYNSQRLNGFWFNSGGPINRHVVGVVAFYGIHPGTLDRSRAVFYSNPYLNRPMPEWTKLITHAEYTDGEVTIKEGVPPYAFLEDYEVIGNPFG